MRVVVDTNVSVSAALKESSWPGAVVRWLDTSDGFLKSTVTEAQVIEVLQRPYFTAKLPPSYLDNVRRIFSKAESIAIVERITGNLARRSRSFPKGRACSWFRCRRPKSCSASPRARTQKITATVRTDTDAGRRYVGLSRMVGRLADREGHCGGDPGAGGMGCPDHRAT